jgi:P-type Cu2+ transporter
MDHENRQQKYTCPMHSEVIKDAPGRCPKCGMTLIPLKVAGEKTEKSAQLNEQGSEMVNSPKHDHHQREGHSHHAGMIDDFKRRFYVVLALTVPIMALSPMIQYWLKIDWSFTGSNYLLLFLSTIVFFYGGWPFMIGLINEVKSKLLGMMTLVAVAITVAYVYSVAIVLGLNGMDFFFGSLLH